MSAVIGEGDPVEPEEPQPRTRLLIVGPRGDDEDDFLDAQAELVAAGYAATYVFGFIPTRKPLVRELIDSYGVATLPDWAEDADAAFQVYVAQRLYMPVRPLARWLT